MFSYLILSSLILCQNFRLLSDGNPTAFQRKSVESRRKLSHIVIKLKEQWGML
jgi:hypothetical protein